MPTREYTKLTPLRQSRGFAVITSTRSNLWLGKDHLLFVETEGYTESYKRFYFRDIQAITLRKTKRAMIWTIVLSVLGLASLAVALFVRSTTGDIGGNIFWAVIALLFAIPLVINFLLGPTCACQLRTAVQIENMPSMGRVRRARKVIARIAPLIAEAQGQITAAEIPQRLQELVAAPANSRAPIADSPDVPPRIAG